MREFCIYIMDPHAKDVLAWVFQRDLHHEVDLARTRFWVPDGAILTEFLLRYSEYCPEIIHQLH